MTTPAPRPGTLPPSRPTTPPLLLDHLADPALVTAPADAPAEDRQKPVTWALGLGDDGLPVTDTFDGRTRGLLVGGTGPRGTLLTSLVLQVAHAHPVGDVEIWLAEKTGGRYAELLHLPHITVHYDAHTQHHPVTDAEEALRQRQLRPFRADGSPLPPLLVLFDELLDWLRMPSRVDLQLEWRQRLAAFQRVATRGSGYGIHLVTASAHWPFMSRDHAKLHVAVGQYRRVAFPAVNRTTSQFLLGRPGAETLDRPWRALYTPSPGRTAPLPTATFELRRPTGSAPNLPHDVTAGVDLLLDRLRSSSG
ncbi:MAG: FtsK/SpoIIIE family [Mycobacterium sp.]|nr:FtsK/SpoIIIE family [Mycobacterium sp.]